MKNFFLCSLLLSLLAACGTTSAKLENTSPGGKVKIMISASRFSSLEAWQVEMKVKAYSFAEDQVAFEIYASAIDEKNVRFKWADENNCTVIFTQSDEAERKFFIRVTPDGIKLSGESNF